MKTVVEPLIADSPMRIVTRRKMPNRRRHDIRSCFSAFNLHPIYVSAYKIEFNCNLIASTFHSVVCEQSIYPNFTMSTSWDNARRHARALETALDSKLSTYSKLAASIARGSSLGGSSSRDELSMEEEGIGGYKLVEEEIEELLSKVGLTY